MPRVVPGTCRSLPSNPGGWTVLLCSAATVFGMTMGTGVFGQDPFPTFQPNASAPARATLESTVDRPDSISQTSGSRSSGVINAGSSQLSQQPARATLANPANVPTTSQQFTNQGAPGQTGRSFLDESHFDQAGVPKAYGQRVQQASFNRSLLSEKIYDVIVEGNETIASDAILHGLQCRPNRIASERMIQEDVAQIQKTRWFYNVQSVLREAPEGPVLVFQVVERPILKSMTFHGNKNLKTGFLEAHTGLRPNQAYDVSANRESVIRIRQLYQEKGYRFAEVNLVKGNSPDDRDVVIEIVEGPKTKIRSIKFVGNNEFRTEILKTKISSKSLKLWLIQGDYDPQIIQNDVLALKQYYMSLGYFDVDVRAEENLSSDRSRVDVSYSINEGSRYRVGKIEAIGNEVVGASNLFSKQKLKSGMDFNERHMREDVNFMSNIYDEQGRIYSQVVPKPVFREGDEPIVDLVYQIDEDVPRFVGAINVHIRGDQPHTRHDVPIQQISRHLKPGHLARRSDIKMAESRLIGSGLWDRQDPPSFNYNATPGVDYLPKMAFRGQSSDGNSIHTADHSSQISAEFWSSDDFLNEIQVDDIFHQADQQLMDAFYQSSSTADTEDDVTAEHQNEFTPSHAQSWSGDEVSSFVPENTRQVRSTIDSPLATAPQATTQRTAHSLVPTSSTQVAASTPVSHHARSTTWDSASTESSWKSPDEGPDFLAGAFAAPKTATTFGMTDSVYGASQDQNYYDPAEISDDRPILAQAVVMNDPEFIFRGQSMEANVYRGQSVNSYGQQVPQDYMYGVSPQGDPFGDGRSIAPPGFVDFDIDVTEGRTGRIMFGVGVNSDAGLVGSAILQEDNFDILRPPTSWADIINGRAWRGAGQSFRIEAVPGRDVSRYMVSWSDPYFMRSDFSLSVSGFYYNRYFEAWREDRLGGRVGLGYIIDRYWSATTSLRLEDVSIKNVPAGAPAILQSVAGNNFLSTASVGLTYDARDNSLMPSRGNYVNLSYEQAFGEFIYPRFDLSGSQYFTLYERPDGYGKHVLSLSGQLGFTGDDTPIFERYYAGGYSSFRGFYFRGVSPIDSGYRVGGTFMAIGTVEYSVPLTASDNLKAVVFSDFGTVEENVSFNDFRASAGVGLRVNIPAMGPAPLAFDFAWPITREPSDRLRVFSFYIGMSR